ncbi:MAG: AAA family ATPase [Clostridium sp.]|nr:AAA family ATPase [Clostridium sp.]
MASLTRPQIQKLIDDTVVRLPYLPNDDQLRLLSVLATYAGAREPADIFILNGYAGTGKTSLIGAFIKALEVASIHSVILAPTGRAAKVAASFSGGKASTIHKRIFRPLSNEPNTQIFLTPNTQADTIFIIDEASLITDCTDAPHSLLSQLLRHVYAAPGCGVILMGDNAQLPPVGQSDSPAMNPDRLRSLGFNPLVFNLENPVRQGQHSGVLHNATLVRHRITEMWQRDDDITLPLNLELKGFADIQAVSSADLSDFLSDSWSSVGVEETILITRSNARANNYNQAVRNMVMMAEDPLVRGERIVISRNDYFWSKTNKLRSFIANGDIAVVEWIGHTERVYGFNFCDVELYLPSDNLRIGAKIMLKSLMSEGPSLSREEMGRFYNVVLAEQEGDFSMRYVAAQKDPFYNALQAKYAYCVTCHKAQGGQWRHVYIDMGGIPADAMNSEFYRWLYTAITRSTEKVFIINPPIPKV